MQESDTSSSPPPPERIGHYLIERELGSGGMGTVYLGRHTETGRQAAVKILPSSLSREPGFVARFGREIAAMQALQSPQIVQIYESGEEEGIYYYAMEYVDGETLTSRLKREKRLPWQEVIDIGVQVCKALKSAHNAGIIHRDLKPSNLLIDSSDQVKLTDFGIAQIFATSKLTVTGGILGTAEYMSPEQAQGHRATRQSDLYSLGAVLYVMLTGRPPFTGKTTLDILQKHRFSQFDSPKRIVPEIPFWLDEIVCKCLSKKSEDRYPDAYVLMLRLQEVPGKVDLKNSEDVRPSVVDADNETVADTGNASHPIGGTFVRDIFRAEMELQQEATRLGRLLDNGWVLGGLLLLLLTGAFLLIRWNRPTPEQMLARGAALMEQPEGPAWDMARTQYFDPLLERDSATWGPRIEPYLPRLQLYELKRQILGRDRKTSQITSPGPESILRQALELRKTGRLAEAREKLIALETLTNGTQQWQGLADMAGRLREELEQHQTSEHLDFVKQALERADRFFQQGEIPAAVAVWRSVLELYDSDPEAVRFVEQARQRLTEAVAEPATVAPFPEKPPAVSPRP